MIKITEGLARKSIKKEKKIETVHVNEVVTDWSYALAEFLVSSLFLFLEILATFTLQMFFSFDSISLYATINYRSLLGIRGPPDESAGA